MNKTEEEKIIVEENHERFIMKREHSGDSNISLYHERNRVQKYRFRVDMTLSDYGGGDTCDCFNVCVSFMYFILFILSFCLIRFP